MAVNVQGVGGTAGKITSELASSMDFKDLFERYQRVGAKNGISIVNYCKINGLRRVKYIADVLRKLISGETDYIALLPMNITK